MFRSRRSVAPLPETAKVAEVVQAYYDAGKRPASHLAPRPEPTSVELPVEMPDETPSVASEPELVPKSEPAPRATVQAHTGHAAQAAPAQQSTPVHKSLAELAQELEAFIEVIRYGDDLGSSTPRN
jgi:hypothetical protein